MPGQKPGGIGQLFDGHIGDGGRVLVKETYTSSCSHCAHITEFESRRKMFEAVDVCRGCMRLICLGCIGQPCVTQEALCEKIEKRYRKHEQLPALAGLLEAAGR